MNKNVIIMLNSLFVIMSSTTMQWGTCLLIIIDTVSKYKNNIVLLPTLQGLSSILKKIQTYYFHN